MKIEGIKHFELEELVDKYFIDTFGANAIWFIDYALLLDMDRLRENCGRIVINNWSDHSAGARGPYFESGLRRFTTPTGAQYSQHKRGHAFDLKPQDMSVLDLYHHITANRDLYPNIRCIENPTTTKTWLHVDSRWTGLHDILIVEP